jgi:prolyl oligopeptidase
MPFSRWTGGIVALVAASTAAAQDTKRLDHVDVYHGIEVEDPYRWMEDMQSEPVREWVAAQDAHTREAAGAVAARPLIHHRLTELMEGGRTFNPVVRGDRYFYAESGGELPASRVMLATNGDVVRAEVLVDPMALDPEGGLRVTRFVPSEDGRYLAYGIVATGSRWETWRILDLERGQLLEDRLVGLNSGASTLAWLVDGTGLYYERFPTPEPGRELTHVVENEVLMFHRLGQPQSEDEVVLDPESPETGLVASMTRDGRYLVVRIGPSGSPRFAVHLLHVATGEWQALIPEADAAYYFLGNHGDMLWFQTNLGAPNWKVVAVDVARPGREHWRDVLAERAFPIDPTVGAKVLGDKLVVGYRRDARLEVHAYRLDGSHAFDVDLRHGGETWSFTGRQHDRYAYYRLHSVVDPGSIYRLDTETGTSTLFLASRLPYDPTAFVTTQVFYTSRDGTRVPMFLVHHEDLQLDGGNPVFMYAYGAFNWAAAPWFQPMVAVWLQMGGVYALPNVRGGGEYGEAWHEAGIGRHKQNAIDDYIAAGEWLIDQGYTSRRLLVGNGGSASGPLIGAAMVQRPELFRASVIDYPALDMLRLEAFTGGRRWRSDFGTVEDRDDFEALYAYSPYHNVVPACYPATIVTPGERDESTVPMHAYKFVAALQAAQRCDEPILLRVSWGAGHTSGRTPAEQVDNWADQLALLSAMLDMEVGGRLADGAVRESD